MVRREQANRKSDKKDRLLVDLKGEEKEGERRVYLKDVYVFELVDNVSVRQGGGGWGTGDGREREKERERMFPISPKLEESCKELVCEAAQSRKAVEQQESRQSST